MVRGFLLEATPKAGGGLRATSGVPHGHPGTWGGRTATLGFFGVAKGGSQV